MKDKKGQALVEFIIIAPIFIMMIMSMIDLGNVIYKKYHLENELDYVVDLYREGKRDEMNNYALNNEFKTNIQKNNDIVTIELSKDVVIYTPILNVVMSNPYKIMVDRVIYSE